MSNTGDLDDDRDDFEDDFEDDVPTAGGGGGGGLFSSGALRLGLLAGLIAAVVGLYLYVFGAGAVEGIASSIGGGSNTTGTVGAATDEVTRQALLDADRQRTQAAAERGETAIITPLQGGAAEFATATGGTVEWDRFVQARCLEDLANMPAALAERLFAQLSDEAVANMLDGMLGALNPEDLENVLATLDAEIKRRLMESLLDSLTDEERAALLAGLSDEEKRRLLSQMLAAMSEEELARLMAEMSADERAAFLKDAVSGLTEEELTDLRARGLSENAAEALRGLSTLNDRNTDQLIGALSDDARQALAEGLARLDDGRLARALEGLSDAEAARLAEAALRGADPAALAALAEGLDDAARAALIGGASGDSLAGALAELSREDLARLLDSLSEEDRKRLLAEMMNALSDADRQALLDEMLKNLSPEDLARLMGELSDEDKARLLQSLLEGMTPEQLAAAMGAIAAALSPEERAQLFGAGIGADPQVVRAVADLMSTQFQAALSTLEPQAATVIRVTTLPEPLSPELLGADGQDEEGEEDGGAPAAAQGAVIVPAGSVHYAQLVTAANSDVPTPILASIVSGPFAGGRVVGSFEVQREYLTMSFELLVYNNREYTIEAIAIDPETTLAGLATDVDHHYLERVFLPAAAAFIEGFAAAVTETATAVTTSGGDTVAESTPELTLTEELAAGFSTAAEVVTEELQNQADAITTTIEVERGAPIGLLFLAAVREQTR